MKKNVEKNYHVELDSENLDATETEQEERAVEVKPADKKESGRSMVEMLGVLAIIGVLSIGGISLYGRSMTKHKANTLVHEANERATVAVAQISSGKKVAEVSLSEFSDTDDTGYGKFDTKIYAADNNQFKISVEEVPSEVCAEMQKAVSGVIQALECLEETPDSKKVAIYFNNDLSSEKKTVGTGNTGETGTGDGPGIPDDSTPETTDDTTDTECDADHLSACTEDNCGTKGGGRWCSGWEVPACATNCCGEVPACQSCLWNGSVVNVPNSPATSCHYKGGSNNGVCRDGSCVLTCTSNSQCTEADTYCNMDEGEGECRPLGGTVSAGGYLISSDDMGYQSAQNWCDAQTREGRSWSLIVVPDVLISSFRPIDFFAKVFGVAQAAASKVDPKDDDDTDVTVLEGKRFWTSVGRAVFYRDGIFSEEETDRTKAVCE